MRAGHRCEGRGSDTVFISYFLVETTQQLFTFANKSETVRSYQPYPWLISTTYMALINHIHGSYQPHPWLISTTSMALINHIHGSYQPHTWLISTTSMALINHIQDGCTGLDNLRCYTKNKNDFGYSTLFWGLFGIVPLLWGNENPV